MTEEVCIIVSGKRGGRAGYCGPCNLADSLAFVEGRLDTGIAKSLDRSTRGLGRSGCGRVRFVLLKSLEEEHGGSWERKGKEWFDAGCEGVRIRFDELFVLILFFCLFIILLRLYITKVILTGMCIYVWA